MDSTLIEDFLYKYTQPEVKSRGKSILNDKAFYIVDESENSLTAIVNASEGKGHYTVTVGLTNNKTIKTSCTCPYIFSGVCKHKVAMLLYLLKSSTRTSSQFSLNIEKEYNQSDVKLPYASLTSDYALANSLNSIYRTSVDFYNNYQFQRNVKITRKEKFHFECNLILWSGNASVKLELKKNILVTSCTCKDKKSALCVHKLLAIMLLTNFYNKPNELETLPSKEEMAVLLAAKYGFKDDIKGFNKYFIISFDTHLGEMIAVPTVEGLQPVLMKGEMKQLFQKNINTTTPLLTNMGSEKALTKAFFFGEDYDNPLQLNTDILTGKYNPLKKSFECMDSQKGFSSKHIPQHTPFTDNQFKISQVFHYLEEVDLDDIFDSKDSLAIENASLVYIIDELNAIKPLLQNEIIIESSIRESYTKTHSKRSI